MTEAQYYRAYRNASLAGSKITRELIEELKTVYVEAVKKAAIQVRNAELAGHADITINSWRNIQLALEEGARNITEMLDDLVRAGVNKAGSGITAVDQKYLIDIINKHNIGISVVEVENLFSTVNDTLVTQMLARIYSTGYTYSQSVWLVGVDYQNQIKQLILSDLAVGRDLVETARDMEVYVQEGRRGLAKRWGDLVKGNTDWLRRVRKDLDYNALRLIRSELYASIQSTAVISGQLNPGCTGMYNWIRQSTEDWNCNCPENERGSPYTAQNVPGYDHPNCFPAGTKIKTINGDKNIEDIKPCEYVITHKGNIKPVLISWKTKYTKEMTIIKTKNGSIEATANHPILSNGNWIQAQSLKSGDNLTSININIESTSFVKSKSNNSPAISFKERSFFRIILYFNLAGVPIPTIDFDGQLYVLKSEINVKSEYSEVRDRFLTEFYNGFIHHSFIWRPDLSTPKLSAFNFLFVRMDTAPGSLISRAGISDLPVFVSTLKRFALRKRFKPMPNKIPVNTSSGNSKPISYLLDREILFAKQINNNVFTKIDSCTHNIPIVSVSCKKVKKYVYNLTVKDDHSYFANGFAVHNCLCIIQPILRNQDQFVKDLTAWSNGESIDYLDAWNTNYFQYIH